MGTPDFAVGALDALVKKHNVQAVFTQPDKPKNRGKKIVFSPVKQCAVDNGIEVYQPLSMRKGEDAEAAFEALQRLSPDCIVVAAYGQILPERVLSLPKYGCINIHASLLPKYRGAAPIQACIIDGETQSGVTVMMMEKGLDTGDMLLKGTVDIPVEMTAGELHDRLAELGAELIIKTLDLLPDGITAEKQDDALSCYAPVISKEMCKIDFSQPAEKVYNFIRGMSPSPCAYTFLNGKRLKVYFSTLSDITSELPVGTIADEKRFSVVCGDGKCVDLTSVQGEGGKRMSADDFLRGNKIEKGTVLGQ
ncbi:MAG: methionyl-tRNA formyltransferase [Eubacterium sp.]|nr:methionyl-tRNA formyltransferase [Eubacterium sp.]